ncbi:MAG TPA: 4-(cytidine 5'-diphospho)-2-C-methyl-D-erythritol kinase [Chryseosolibacter sp.]|nr:4-(cytidine 5'-diphospho)-2-C-methyl-D-erythritol kinase [Chryseosolibacter sp.]
MVFFPPCKINLGLRIIEKRNDGFHNIETCFFPLPWSDVLEIIPSSSFVFTSSGIPVPGDLNQNLCVKAYELLQEAFNLPAVQIHLHKILPIGAGLGGGSSDAAYMLNGLNEIFELNISDTKLQQFASILGSDCAFFLKNQPMIGTGKGDELSSVALTLKGKFVVVAKPGVHISTHEAYAGVKPSNETKAIRNIVESVPIADWRDLLENDFEASIFLKYPEIAICKHTMYDSGAVYASMTGSGSSVFGIFDNVVDLKSKFQGCDYWAGELHN